VYLYQRSFLYAGGEDVKKLYVRSTYKSQQGKKTQLFRGRCFPPSIFGGFGQITYKGSIDWNGPLFDNARIEISRGKHDKNVPPSVFKNKNLIWTIPSSFAYINLLALALQASTKSPYAATCNPIFEKFVGANAENVGHDEWTKLAEKGDFKCPDEPTYCFKKPLEIMKDAGKKKLATEMKELVYKSPECFINTVSSEKPMLNFLVERMDSYKDAEAKARPQNCLEEIAKTWDVEPKEFIKGGKCPSLLFDTDDEDTRQTRGCLLPR